MRKVVGEKIAIEDIMPVLKEELEKLTDEQFKAKINAWLKDNHVDHYTSEINGDMYGHMCKLFNKEVTDDDMHQLEVLHTNFMRYIARLKPEEKPKSDQDIIDDLGKAQGEEAERIKKAVVKLKLLWEDLRDADDSGKVVMFVDDLGIVAIDTWLFKELVFNYIQVYEED